MKAWKTILSVLLVLLCAAMLAFSGYFLWSVMPREKAQPEKVAAADALPEPEPQKPTLEPAPQKEPEAQPPAAEEPEPAAPAEPEVPEEPEAQPEPEPLRNPEEIAQERLKAMSLEERVWQLFITTPEALTGVQTATLAGDLTKDAIAERPVGGLCYFAANLVDRQQTVDLLHKTQSYARTPMFLCVDEEGGLVSRAGSNEKLGVTHFDAPQVYGEQADMAQVFGVGKTMAQELGALGFNLDFAPVADVVTNPENTEIGNRSYSSDPEVAGAMVSAMVEGLQRGGMISCLKHFPGHGSTSADSHAGTSVSTRTLEELRETEWLPFRAGIDKGAAFVMLSHLTNENLSSLPADLSPEVVSYLRDELDFEGIIITDSHQMGAITDHYASGEAAILALKAGVDMVLMPRNLQDAFDAVLDAVERAEIPEAQINESVHRILTVKAAFGILQ